MEGEKASCVILNVGGAISFSYLPQFDILDFRRDQKKYACSKMIYCVIYIIRGSICQSRSEQIAIFSAWFTTRRAPRFGCEAVKPHE